MNSLNLFAKQTFSEQIKPFSRHLALEQDGDSGTTGNPANVVLCLRVQDVSSTEQGIS